MPAPELRPGCPIRLGPGEPESGHLKGIVGLTAFSSIDTEYGYYSFYLASRLSGCGPPARVTAASRRVHHGPDVPSCAVPTPVWPTTVRRGVTDVGYTVGGGALYNPGLTGPLAEKVVKFTRTIAVTSTRKQWVPLAQLLNACDAVVHHGGAGSMMTAADAGIPQLIVPQGADNFTNAAAAEAQGFALRAEDDAVNGELLDALLNDKGLREAALATRDEIAALPSPAHGSPTSKASWPLPADPEPFAPADVRGAPSGRSATLTPATDLVRDRRRGATAPAKGRPRCRCPAPVVRSRTPKSVRRRPTPDRPSPASYGMRCRPRAGVVRSSPCQRPTAGHGRGRGRRRPTPGRPRRPGGRRTPGKGAARRPPCAAGGTVTVNEQAPALTEVGAGLVMAPCTGPTCWTRSGRLCPVSGFAWAHAARQSTHPRTSCCCASPMIASRQVV
ncbi:nucleotide disphospho-sugar-binding domain-containing protein [Streptomyces sp. NPDC050619]|uniref:glycosyltransferase n=1 Tax=Streptomyces sp. NPDC050619 TaxID=3157214 RepID=UPI0034199E35